MRLTICLMIPVVACVLACGGAKGPTVTVDATAAATKSGGSPTTTGDAATIGDAEVRVTALSVRRVKLIDAVPPARAADSAEEHLVIEVEVRNTSDSKLLDFKRWEDVTRGYVTVADEKGNYYKRTTFGTAVTPDGALAGAKTVYPGKTVADVYVFERPTDAAATLTITFDAGRLGQNGNLRFRFPAGKWRGE